MKDVVYRSAQAAAAAEMLYARVLDQWPVPATRIMVDTRQGPTFVIASGPEEGPPVVLLHGAQANSAAWLPDVSSWTVRFRLYAIDMIGEAGLSARVRPELDNDAHALWIGDVLSALAVRRAAFVGTWLGGWVALDFARRRPDVVRALALICPAGVGRQKNFLLKVFPLFLLGSWGKRKIRELVFGPAPAKMPEDLLPIADLMKHISKAIHPRVVAIPRLTDEQLRTLTMPMLAIVGGRDALIDSADTKERLKRVIPHVQVDYIEDGYHFLPGQTERIKAFLIQATSAESATLGS